MRKFIKPLKNTNNVYSPTPLQTLNRDIHFPIAKGGYILGNPFNSKPSP